MEEEIERGGGETGRQREEENDDDKYAFVNYQSEEEQDIYYYNDDPTGFMNKNSANRSRIFTPTYSNTSTTKTSSDGSGGQPGSEHVLSSAKDVNDYPVHYSRKLHDSREREGNTHYL